MKPTSLTLFVILAALGVIVIGIFGSIPGLSLNSSGQAQESLLTPIFQYPDPPNPNRRSCPATSSQPRCHPPL
jgi:hypothetical protein